MTDDIVKRAAEALEGVTLHLDHDGYFCARGPSDCAVVLVAYPVRDESGEIWQPYVCNAMIERFNAYPTMAAEITALRDKLATVLDRAAETHGAQAAEITALRAEVERLTAERDESHSGWTDTIALLEKASARLDDYDAALKAAGAERDRLREAMAEKLRVKPLVWTRARDGYPYEWEAWCDLMGGYYYANTDPQKREIGAVRAARILAALATKGEMK